ncbi:MAG: hypothetical protein GY943_26905 [Chloroflexi bacterium]|nr:hypothetical protein [Chloroflexota bacterium]
MPVKPNFVERLAFFNLNAVPSSVLDLAGLFAYQAVSTANELGLFEALAKQTQSCPDLARQLQLQERGLLTLLEALEPLGYVELENGRYQQYLRQIRGLREYERCRESRFWRKIGRLINR